MNHIQSNSSKKFFYAACKITNQIFFSRIHGHMSSVRIQHDVYAQVLVNHVYDADVLPRIKANTGNN